MKYTWNESHFMAEFHCASCKDSLYLKIGTVLRSWDGGSELRVCNPCFDKLNGKPFDLLLHVEIGDRDPPLEERFKPTRKKAR